MSGDFVIFSTFKPFVGHIKMIQENAIGSWRVLDPRPDILLMENDHFPDEIPGVTFISGIEHYRDIPMVDDIFLKAYEYAPDAIRAYLNCDIIVTQRVFEAIDLVSQRFDRFMVISQRWHWDVPYPITFDDDGEWIRAIESDILKDGHLDPPVAIDLFASNADVHRGMPSFAIGHYAWDNWLVWVNDREREDIAVVDVSAYVVVIHQDHRGQRHSRVDHLANRNRSFMPSREAAVGGRSDMTTWLMDQDGSIRKRREDEYRHNTEGQIAVSLF